MARGPDTASSSSSSRGLSHAELQLSCEGSALQQSEDYKKAKADLLSCTAYPSACMSLWSSEIFLKLRSGQPYCELERQREHGPQNQQMLWEGNATALRRVALEAEKA